ncbi:hypothetical protein TCDM_10485 [Trypanosoma cruzi Dm28c]|uniref:Uncharacterized protein n=1 Tax=Trypanosoma cruzi Dm28c TaxID=1416333 RepID=V5D320_TRYCR|nr:hypothetical protein TCDM_10485 [Trypanosoma cruzi Dm28c]
MESNRGDERCGRHTQRAHHTRRGQQPGMHRTPHTTHNTHSNPRQTHTHTHSPAAAPTHRWKREKQTGAAHKAPPHAHTARAVRRVGTPHGGYTHTRGGAAHTATQKQSNNKKGEILAHHVDCWSTGSAANIHHKNNSVAIGPRSYSAHTTSCRPGNHRSCSTRKNISARNGTMQASIYLCFCLNVGRCLHALFCFFRGQTFMPGSCVGDFCRVHNYVFFPLLNVSCVGAANNSVFVVAAFRW